MHMTTFPLGGALERRLFSQSRQGGRATYMPTGRAALDHSAAEANGTSRTRKDAASGTNSTRRPWNAPSVER